MKRVIIGFTLLATVALHADTLKDASNWPDLVYSAKQRGIDYPATVARAQQGDVSALVILFRHTPHTDGSGAESHCVVLRRLLELLVTKSSATRCDVSQRLFAAQSQKQLISTSVALGRSASHLRMVSARTTSDCFANTMIPNQSLEPTQHFGVSF